MLVTHRDLDGLGCELVYRHKFPRSEWAIRCDFEDLDAVCARVLTDLQKGRVESVIFADIAPREPYLRQILASTLNVTVLDHHANNDWGRLRKELLYIKGDFDNEKCGAMLLAEYLFGFVPQDLYGVLRAIQAWDLWLEDDSFRRDGEDLQRLFAFWGWDRMLSELQGVVRTQDPSGLWPLASDLKKNDERYIVARVKRAEVLTDEDGCRFAWCMAERCISEVGNALSKLPGVDYGAIYVPVHSKVELRGTGKVNLGELARKKGGGGHNNAAGYPVTALGFPKE